MGNKRLGIGIIGGGFVGRFHIRSFVGVRDADVRGVVSRRGETAEEAAELARELQLGDCRAYASITEMIADPAIDALWICAPNFTRIEVMEEIVVVVNKSGDPVDVDALYLDQLRTRVIKDFESLQAEQEKEVWRQGLQTSFKPPESRISWGYDAKEEAAMRRSSINDLPTDRVKPATIISVSF